MKPKIVVVFIGIGAFLLLITSFILPNFDDWNWMHLYPPLKHNHFSIELLKPQNFYWRPFEMTYYFFLAKIPGCFPFLNHLQVVFAHVISGYLVYELGAFFYLKKNIRIWITFYFLFATTAMGTLLSADGMAQAYATLFGLIGTMCFLKFTHTKKYLMWLVFSIIAVLSKESGIVWFVATPLIFLYYNYKENNSFFSKKIIFSFLKNCLLGFAVALVYFSIRLSLNADSLNTSHTSYELNLLTFINNFFIVFVASFVSIDTSAIMYTKEWLLVIATVILNIPWLLCLAFCVIKVSTKKEKIWEILFLIFLMICVSSPALVTRAGEISPHPTLAIISFILGVLFNDIKINWKLKFAIGCFIVSTLVVDIHKYYLAYQAGMIGNKMAKEIKKQTKVEPNKVLLIMVDYYSNLKSGAFFPVAGHSFNAGAAAIKEYNYKYPKYLKKELIKDGNKEFINKQIADVIEKQTEKFDCIWITNRDEVRIINLYENY